MALPSHTQPPNLEDNPGSAPTPRIPERTSTEGQRPGSPGSWSPWLLWEHTLALTQCSICPSLSLQFTVPRHSLPQGGLFCTCDYQMVLGLLTALKKRSPLSPLWSTSRCEASRTGLSLRLPELLTGCVHTWLTVLRTFCSPHLDCQANCKIECWHPEPTPHQSAP